MDSIRRIAHSLAALAMSMTMGAMAAPLASSLTPAVNPTVPAHQLTDAALVKRLPGFVNRSATVNGVTLHYVTGGQGPVVVLLPGWPETWWEWRHIMPGLARTHTVIAVDLRGMGTSSKPQGGYDKKTMAGDMHALVTQLGVDKVDIVGHDIGSMVAFSFAANYPAATGKVVLVDVPHPDAALATWPLLPDAGTFTDRLDEHHPYVWWFAFHQVQGLPEDLLEGRAYIEQAWMFHYLMQDDRKLDTLSRAVYSAAYSSRDAVRAGNAWYRAFPQDILDDGTYAPLTMPLLAVGGPGYQWLKMTLATKAPQARVVKVADSGHFIPEEQPERLLQYLVEFLQ